MLAFLLGLILGLVAFSIFYYRSYRHTVDLEEQARHVQQEKQIVIDFMHDMVEALGEGLSRDDLFHRIVHASVISTGALSACIFERTDRNTLRGAAVEGLFPPHRPLSESAKAKLTTRAKYIEQILKAEEFPMGDGVVGRVAENRKPVLIENGAADPRIVKHDDPALAVNTAICAPIMFQDEVIGVLAVCNSSDGLPFNETDFSLVQSLAEQSGMAIRNNEFLNLQVEKKQLDVELELAHSIQLMLVPSELPHFEGIEMDARYISSRKVGGDLYDVVRFSDRRFGIAIADVSGKGIPASMVMAVCRTNLRHFAHTDDCPAEILRRVNRAMADEMRPGMYITMLFAVLDLEANRMTFARAGHERPILCSKHPGASAPTTEFLASEGMPVGLVDAALFDEVIEARTVEIRPGDVFVFYTDGLTESVNEAGREYSGARLADAVRSLRLRSAAELNTGILEAVDRFTDGQGFTDDLTLLSVKRV